jgi:hypothetical protein
VAWPASGVVAGLAVVYGTFGGLVAGFLLVGVAAALPSIRFAAADSGDAAFRHARSRG